MDPEGVGELVEVPVGAGQQVLRRDGRAFSPLSGRAGALPAAAGTVLMGELGEIGAEWMGVGVRESGKRSEVVAAGATEPLREHSGRDAEVITVSGVLAHLRLPREGAQCVDLWPEVEA